MCDFLGIEMQFTGEERLFKYPALNFELFLQGQLKFEIL